MEFERRKLFLYAFIGVLIASIVVYFIFNFFYFVYKVDGNSMLPLLKNNNKVVVKKINKDYILKRFDIVILNRGKLNKRYIKRIIGLPNDKMRIDNHSVFINDNKINEPFFFSNGKNEKGNLNKINEITLSDNEYFLMGDNRMISKDSRFFGPVLKKDIIGKALFVYWPLKSLY